MREPNEFQEIENLGDTEEELEPYPYEEPKKREGGSMLPLLQTALCVLALLALLILKFADTETYGKVTNWYKTEASREIELPKWKSGGETVSSLPSETSSEAPATVGVKDDSLQRLSC